MPDPRYRGRFSLCPACKGKGTVVVKLVADCPMCFGIGTVFGQTCEVCGGKKVIKKREEQVCKSCLGTKHDLGLEECLQHKAAAD